MALLVDAHVHLHPCFAEEELFESARVNFHAARQRLALPTSTPGVLLLAECSGQDVFSRLYERAALQVGPVWTMRRTLESDSLLACRAGIAELVLLAGRQIATGDGLEVLALGCRRKVRDGLATAETLAQVWEGGALAIVPWGFAKWWLGRGRLLADLLERSEPKRFFLGDNGGRPRLAPLPRLFGLAAERGIRILPGSDPLPFARQARRAGSYGCALEGELDLLTPGAKLKEILATETVKLRTFGARRSLAAFARDQLTMQLRKLAGAGQARG